MNETLQIGVTGGIGSGKSIVCSIFHALGVQVYNADNRAKIIMTTDGNMINAIKKEFGELSFNSDGLNKRFIGREVFGDAEKLAKLNKLVHPRVEEDYKTWVHENRLNKYLVKEAALLFDAGTSSKLDSIVWVSAPERIRTERVLLRDPQRSESEIKQIISKQMREEDVIGKADYVILNDGTALVIPQVLNLHAKFLVQSES